MLPKSDPRFIGWKKSLKKRPPPWNKGKTRFNNSSVEKISKTFKSRKIDNFKNWRNKARKLGLIPDSYLVFRHNSDLAFLIGLTLGDGNIGIFPRTECLRIVLGTDKPLLIKYARQIIKSVVGKEPSVIKRTGVNCCNVTVYQKKLSKRLGIPSGPRKYLKILLPDWIWKRKIFLLNALRGLFEAEGSFSIHEQTYTYNLSFSNTNISLLNEVQKALTFLGFHPERRQNAVRLRRKIETFNFVSLIGFRKYPLV